MTGYWITGIILSGNQIPIVPFLKEAIDLKEGEYIKIERKLVPVKDGHQEIKIKSKVFEVAEITLDPNLGLPEIIVKPVNK